MLAKLQEIFHAADSIVIDELVQDILCAVKTNYFMVGEIIKELTRIFC